MAQLKTPGVYLVEKNAFPNSIVEVATAVPAFIGYTQKAENGTKSLLNKPFKVSSLSEFMQYYGGPPEYRFALAEAKGKDDVSDLSIKDKKYTISRSGTVFRLFDAIRLFYQNGGGPCYIVSVGDYSNDIVKGLLDGTDDKAPGGGLVMLEKEQD